MNTNNANTLYIFIDESGNFDFSIRGTKFFVLTATSTTQPLTLETEFLDLKYKLLSEGIDQEFFHATTDKQMIRDSVYNILNKLDSDSMDIDTVVAEKNKTHPSLYTAHTWSATNNKQKLKTTCQEEDFYKVISRTLLQYIFKRHDNMNDVGQIVVVLGSLFTTKKRRYIVDSLTKFLKEKTTKPFYIYFHTSASDINCQLADYCGWAIYVSHERNEQRPLQAIRNKVRSDFSIFDKGTTVYY